MVTVRQRRGGLVAVLWSVADDHRAQVRRLANGSGQRLTAQVRPCRRGARLRLTLELPSDPRWERSHAESHLDEQMGTWLNSITRLAEDQHARDTPLPTLPGLLPPDAPALDDLPVVVEEQRPIAAPAPTVWDAVQQFERDDGRREVVVPGSPTGPGELSCTVVQVSGRPAAVLREATVWQPSHRSVHRLQGGASAVETLLDARGPHCLVTVRIRSCDELDAAAATRELSEDLDLVQHRFLSH
jgi:hypothetical protein